MAPRLRLRRSHHNQPSAQTATSPRSRSRSPAPGQTNVNPPPLPSISSPAHQPASSSTATTPAAQHSAPVLKTYSARPSSASSPPPSLPPSSQLQQQPASPQPKKTIPSSQTGRPNSPPVVSHTRTSPRPSRSATVTANIHAQPLSPTLALNGEQLAAPTVRSASLPFNVYLSTSSSGSASSSSSSSALSSAPIVLESGVQNQSTSSVPRTPDTDDAVLRALRTDHTDAVSSPVSTDRPASPVLHNQHNGTPVKESRPYSPPQHPARRFFSEPTNGPEAPAANLGQSSPQRKPQRRTSRVHSLARWYDRLSTGNAGSVGGAGSFSNAVAGTTANDAMAHDGATQTQAPSGLQALSLPHDYGSASYSNVSSYLDDIARLRVALKAERDARADAEALAASLQNALKHSKKKVDSQRAKIDELTIQVNETRSAIPPMNEILVIAEKHFRTKEMALKKIIGAQQSAYSAHKDRRKASKHRDKRHSSTLSSHRLYLADADL